jgi:alkanesulfonate monooxygenase SsuD/methylene tetrahydromethanopterin reductase-like flavin-dependent oxidoreductase (luciferase family)
MRFTYAEGMTHAAYYAPLAQAAEAAGYTSMTIADSLIYPQESDSKYPYTDTGDREFLLGKEFFETFFLCALLFAVAKQASSLAFLSGNRLGLGVGLSPWPEDFAALGVPWEKRGKRMDECMDILRGLMQPGEQPTFFGYQGEFFDIAPLQQCPAPTEKVPLLVGGHSDAALRRAVLKGDGWMHAGGDGEELDRLLTRLEEIRKEEGDDRDDFEIHVISYDAYTVDGVQRLQDRGVTDCIVGFRVPYIMGPDTEPLEKKIQSLQWYGENIIEKCS